MTSKSARDRACVNADQVEGAALQRPLMTWVTLDAAIRDELIAGTLDPDAGKKGRVLTAAELDERIETLVSGAKAEIERRQDLLKAAYPFELNSAGTSLRYRGSSTLIYEFCVAVSLSHDLKTGAYKVLPPSFERLTCDVMKAFLGEGARYYRTGWPPDGDRPSKFKATIEALHAQTKEWHWMPHPDAPPDPDHVEVKDGGLDLVVWKPLGDDRIGALVLAGQCACGDDWAGKLHDLDEDRMTLWMRPSISKFIRVFATPRHVHGLRWLEASAEAHLLIDRVRLTKIAEHPAAAKAILGAARTPYDDLIRIVLPKFAYKPGAPVAQPPAAA